MNEKKRYREILKQIPVFRIGEILKLAVIASVLFSAVPAHAAISGSYSTNVESGQDGWQTDGLWHVTSSRYNSYSHSFWYGSENTKAYNTGNANSGSLTSPEIALAAGTKPVLNFWYWYQTESNKAYDKKIVQISVNGGAWTDLKTLTDSQQMWIKDAIDLSGYAGKNVRVRFLFDTVDGSLNDYEGWYVDDIWVTYGTVSTTAPAPVSAAPVSTSAPAPTPASTSTPVPASTSAPAPAPNPSGKTYYVAKNGYDGNPGTESQPWLTITKAANTAVAGDTVYVKQGTYNERVIVKNSGSPGKYITFAAYPGNSATIDGSGISMDKSNGLFQITGKQYIRVSGLRVVNSAHEGIRVQGPGTSNIIIEKNYIYGTSGSGISAWGVVGSGNCAPNCAYDGIVNIVIDGNELNNVFTGKNGDVGEEISIAMGVDTFEVKNNHIHDGLNSQSDVGQGIGGEGIDAKQGVRNGKIYNNQVHNLKRPARATVGIYIGEWDRSTYNIDVFNNVVHDIDGYGIMVGTERGGPVDSIRIYNNVVYNNLRDGVIIDSYGQPHGPISNVKIVNNVAYGNGLEPGRGGIVVFDNNAKNVVVRNNIVSKNREFQISVPSGSSNIATSNNLIDGYRGFAWSIYKETYGGPNSVTGDPRFVNPGNADFHLSGSSPAIDKGTSTDAPNADLDGNARPKGAGYDIGAFEYVP